MTRKKLKIKEPSNDWFDKYLEDTFNSVEHLSDIIQFKGDGLYIPAAALNAFLNKKIPLKFIMAIKIMNTRGWEYLCKKGKHDQAMKELAEVLKTTPEKILKMRKKYADMICTVEEF